jgi:hypothetical protein
VHDWRISGTRELGIEPRNDGTEDRSKGQWPDAGGIVFAAERIRDGNEPDRSRRYCSGSGLTAFFRGVRDFRGWSAGVFGFGPAGKSLNHEKHEIHEKETHGEVDVKALEECSRHEGFISIPDDPN